MKARSVVSGDRSRRPLSSELPSVRPRRPPGDMVGDGTRRGVKGGTRRRGVAYAAIVTVGVREKERWAYHMGRGRRRESVAIRRSARGIR